MGTRGIGEGAADLVCEDVLDCSRAVSYIQAPSMSALTTVRIRPLEASPNGPQPLATIGCGLPTFALAPSSLLVPFRQDWTCEKGLICCFGTEHERGDAVQG